MPQLRYIEEPITLELDTSLCNGCGLCVEVCPRACFAMEAKRAKIVDRGTCLECGACALNCTRGAITVDAGVGCATAIIKGWITHSEPNCDCG